MLIIHGRIVADELPGPFPSCRPGRQFTDRQLSRRFRPGRDLDAWPQPVEAGIRLHRRIDAYTDRHPDVLAALGLMSPVRRRFAGIIVDVAFDHFLVRHWSRYEARALPNFVAGVYRRLGDEAALMPETARLRFERMREYDWLVSYGELEVVARALDAIASRLSRRTALYGAGEEVVARYDALETCFLRFYPQLLRWVEEQG
ncbi:ACP phosphodiesterase [Marinobacterium aestuariivivens]|uniref:ACP phosphodiesterase n=1 Tax=Marinobacterium aestuariivivens TaxID=1698799 RepID=A0ABW2A7W0_9GAMM